MMVFCCSLHTFFFLESQSHRLLLESFFESLCCQVCIISLGEGDSEMQQSDFHIHPGGSPGFPGRMSPAAQATPSPWHSWFEVGNGVLWATSVVCRSNFGNICNLLLLEMTALHTEVGWLRCQKGAQPRVLWGHRKRPPPQGHKEWPFQGWTCDKSWFHTRPGLPVCWVPLRISGHLSGSGPHRELQTLFTEMRASCIWQVPWKNITSYWTRGIHHSTRKAIPISQAWKKFPLCHPLVTTNSLIASFWKMAVESPTEFRKGDPSLAPGLRALPSPT